MSFSPVGTFPGGNMGGGSGDVTTAELEASQVPQDVRLTNLEGATPGADPHIIKRGAYVDDAGFIAAATAARSKEIRMDADCEAPVGFAFIIDASCTLVAAGGHFYGSGSDRHVTVECNIEGNGKLFRQPDDRTDRFWVDLEQQQHGVDPRWFGLIVDDQFATGNHLPLADAILASQRVNGALMPSAGEAYFNHPVSPADWNYPGLNNNGAGVKAQFTMTGKGNRKSIYYQSQNAYTNIGNWTDATVVVAGTICFSVTTGAWYYTQAGGTTAGDDSNPDGRTPVTTPSDTGVKWQAFNGWFNFSIVFNAKISMIGWRNKSQTSAWPTLDVLDKYGNVRNVGLPLLYIGSAYNLHLEDMWIRNSLGPGFWIKEGQQVTVNQCNFEFCKDAGMVTQGVSSMSVDGLDCEQMPTETGLLILPILHGRDQNTALDIRNFYGEATAIGIETFGVSGLSVTGGILQSGAMTLKVGPGTKNCFFDMAVADGDIELSEFSHANKLIANLLNPLDNSIIDLGSNNVIEYRAADAMRWDPMAGEAGGTSFMPNTSPAQHFSITGRDWLFNDPGVVASIPDAVSHVPAISGVGHRRVVPGTAQYSEMTGSTGMTVGGQYYLYLAASIIGIQQGKVQAAIRNRGGNFYGLDPDNGLYDQYESFQLPYRLNQISYWRIPFLASVDGQMRIDLSLFNVGAGYMQYHYCNISTNPRARMEHIIGGVSVGYNDKAIMPTASLPPAAEVPVGSEVYDTTTKTLKHSNGTIWA